MQVNRYIGGFHPTLIRMVQWVRKGENKTKVMTVITCANEHTYNRYCLVRSLTLIGETDKHGARDARYRKPMTEKRGNILYFYACVLKKKNPPKMPKTNKKY